MIKRNKALLHLDLSHTNLTEYMLWNIGKALSRARSVISVHLSGNQGISPTLIDQLQTRIRCKEQLTYQKVGFHKGLDNHGKELTEKMTSTRKGRFRELDEAIVQEKMYLRQLSKQNVENGEDYFGEAKDQKKLIFERKLGHKNDIPGVG